ncbi:MAG TPA: hypothetical protein VNA19_13220 [Pyrinomonadaceae bacterium]|nr:hypothetical protein [Pyrinomonadaceae bacterium]
MPLPRPPAATHRRTDRFGLATGTHERPVPAFSEARSSDEKICL